MSVHLAGAVLTQQGVDFARAQFERDAAQGSHSGERFGDGGGLEESHDYAIGERLKRFKKGIFKPVIL